MLNVRISKLLNRRSDSPQGTALCCTRSFCDSIWCFTAQSGFDTDNWRMWKLNGYQIRPQKLCLCSREKSGKTKSRHCAEAFSCRFEETRRAKSLCEICEEVSAMYSTRREKGKTKNVLGIYINWYPSKLSLFFMRIQEINLFRLTSSLEVGFFRLLTDHLY